MANRNYEQSSGRGSIKTTSHSNLPKAYTHESIYDVYLMYR